MRSLFGSYRMLLAALVFGLSITAAPIPAEDELIAAMPWQDVINSQVQAFRDRDAPTAFGYAGIGFQVTFPNAEVFFEAILQSGYAPIMESQSHSFGSFKMIGTAGVIQAVKFVGKDQLRYEAVYQLTEEPGGWRVQGVQLFKAPGIAI